MAESNNHTPDTAADEALMTLIAGYPEVEPTLIIHVLRVCDGDIAKAESVLADTALANPEGSATIAQRHSETTQSYSIIFPSCSPEVQEALEELAAGRTACLQDDTCYDTDEWSRLHCSSEIWSARKDDHRKLSETLLEIVDIAEQAATQTKQHMASVEDNLQEGFALASPEKLLQQIAKRHEGSGLLPIAIDSEALDQLNMSALPFLLSKVTPFTIDANTTQIETSVGIFNVTTGQFSVRLVFNPAHSEVHMSVTSEGITIELSKFDVHIEGCNVGWERTTCPTVFSGAELEARAVDCVAYLTIGAEEASHTLDLNRLDSSEQQGRASPRDRQVKFTVRTLKIDPQTVKLNRLLTTVRDSWLSLVYNWVLTSLKLPLVGMIEEMILGTLKDMEQSISQNAEWIPITVLAILQGAKGASEHAND